MQDRNIGGLPALAITEDAESLTQAIIAAGMLPANAVNDAAHVAVPAVHAIDDLLTWNCKHLANVQIARRICAAQEGVKAWINPEEHRRFVGARRRAFEEQVELDMGVAKPDTK